MLSTRQEVNGSILLDAFQLYKLPLHISQDYIDPVDGHVHRFQNRCLGTCSLTSGSIDFPQVTFYEITESEISESKLHQEVSSPEEEPTPDSPPNNNLDGLANFALNNNNIKGLPPKKRKRRRMIRYEIIFTVDKGPIHLSPEHTFFALPRDALIFSFFPQSCGISQNSQCACHSYPPPIVEETAFKTKLEEFAAVCSTSCKLTLPDQSKSEGHVNNIVLSNVPHELYRAIKQMVSAYEIMCQNMMELMKLHSERVIHHKSIPETAISLPNQSDDDYQLSKNDDWSSSDEQLAWEKDIKVTVHRNNASNQIKKCLYCGSKSTPMWRRGPQGAGTLCNACGVKWKHGKILNGNDAPDTIVPVPNRRGSKAEKKRKRSNASHVKRINKKRATEQQQEYYDTFAVPAPREPIHPINNWESASSSTSDRSPLESFSSSPNHSPSITNLMEQDIKRDISSLMTYDTETLSVYVGEDAVEAAAVLTLLKRS
ncbi:hypothetical protein INT48_006975 [Thamnidium elegans]|uniref:GATA-type domain-containing protein n=1 Tax=Thamnidium elegans TaxID=101142 RepID=A0A8H7SYP0_9FUNG|nr:hypothetical protein INT48_006975 [Thamnidium elegans]